MVLRIAIALAVALAVAVLLWTLGVYGPEGVQGAIGWLPGLISGGISRYILNSRGVHGLGYFDPALDRLTFLIFVIVVGLIVGGLSLKLRRN